MCQVPIVTLLGTHSVFGEWSPSCCCWGRCKSDNDFLLWLEEKCLWEKVYCWLIGLAVDKNYSNEELAPPTHLPTTVSNPQSFMKLRRTRGQPVSVFLEQSRGRSGWFEAASYLDTAIHLKSLCVPLEDTRRGSICNQICFMVLLADRALTKHKKIIEHLCSSV